MVQSRPAQTEPFILSACLQRNVYEFCAVHNILIDETCRLEVMAQQASIADKM